MSSRALRDQWIAELRSGNYTQCQKTLRIDDNFCCLGVLCDMIEPKNWEKTHWHIKHYLFNGTVHLGNLPELFRIQVGLSHNQVDQLGVLNDSYKTFDEIADVIEEWGKHIHD